jgi:hypothetical protein
MFHAEMFNVSTPHLSESPASVFHLAEGSCAFSKGAGKMEGPVAVCYGPAVVRVADDRDYNYRTCLKRFIARPP